MRCGLVRLEGIDERREETCYVIFFVLIPNKGFDFPRESPYACNL